MVIKIDVSGKLADGIILKTVCLDNIDITTDIKDKPKDTASGIIWSYYVLSNPLKKEITANIIIIKSDTINCKNIFLIWDSFLL